MSLFDRIFGKRQTFPHHSYIPEFSKVTEINQISRIFEWSLDPNQDVARRCAAAIHRVLINHPIRNHQLLYQSFRYLSLKKEDLKQFADLDPNIKHSLYCIASMNGNGYVREAALSLILTSPSQLSLPFILYRLADWVPEIRLLAERELAKYFKQQELRFLIQSHPIINWLLTVKRIDLSPLHHEIGEILFSDENVEELVSSFESYEEKERYYICKNLFSRDKVDTKLITKTARDKYYLIRLLALNHINFKEQPELLKRFLGDRNRKIRKQAVTLIPADQTEHFQEVLTTLIFDTSAGIRSYVREIIANNTVPDLRQLYQQELATNPSFGCLMGLSEVGNKSDLPQIRQFLTSDYSKLRKAALLAISNLDPDEAKELAISFLDDPSNSVKKASSVVIQQNRKVEDLPRLRRVYDNGNADTKKFVLKTISKYGGWSIAGDFLKGMNEEDEQVNRVAYSLLHKWYHYSMKLGIALTKDDKEYVLGILSEVNLSTLNLPKGIEKIILELPFLFERD